MTDLFFVFLLFNKNAHCLGEMFCSWPCLNLLAFPRVTFYLIELCSPHVSCATCGFTFRNY